MSEHDEKTIRILQFSGKEEDWRMWSAKFMAKAKLRGYHEILDGTKNAPKDTVADLTETNKKLAILNDKAYNELVLSCIDETSFSIVDGAKTDDIKGGDAKTAWDQLKLRFEPDTGTELVRLMREYNSMHMKTNDDPDEYLTKLENCRSKMKRKPFNHEIKDRDFFIHILNTLPNQYETVVESLERKLGKGTLTITKIKTDLRSKFGRLKIMNEDDDDENALLAHGSGKRFKKQFKGTCRICGKQGHKAIDCWENPRNKNKNKNKNNLRFTGRCNYCNKVGHKEKDCFKKKRDEEQKLKQNEGANVAVSEETDTVFMATDDGCSWTSENYYVVMSEDLHSDDEDSPEGFNDKVRSALMLDHDIAMITYSDGEEKSEEKDQGTRNYDNADTIAFFDNDDEERRSESKDDGVEVTIETLVDNDHNETGTDESDSDSEIHTNNFMEVAARAIQQNESNRNNYRAPTWTPRRGFSRFRAHRGTASEWRALGERQAREMTDETRRQWGVGPTSGPATRPWVFANQDTTQTNSDDEESNNDQALMADDNLDDDIHYGSDDTDSDENRREALRIFDMDSSEEENDDAGLITYPDSFEMPTPWTDRLQVYDHIDHPYDGENELDDDDDDDENMSDLVREIDRCVIERLETYEWTHRKNDYGHEWNNESDDDMALTVSNISDGNLSGELWIGDTGASTHMTNDPTGMFDCKLHQDKYIKVGDGNRIQIKSTGKKKCSYMGKEITLHDVHYIPGLRCNLFSILTSLSRGWKINNDGVNLRLKKGEVMLTFDEVVKCPTGQLIGVRLTPKQRMASDEAFISKTDKGLTYDEAHTRLSHSNEHDVMTTMKYHNIKVKTPNNKICEYCAIAKIKQSNIKKKGTTVTNYPGERLFIDISSVNSTSLGGSKYLNLIVDHYTNFKWPVFLKEKSDLTKKMIPIIKWLEANNKQVKYIRCDNAGENRALEKACNDGGYNITFEYTPPGSPQYNGAVERAFPAIYGKMRANFNGAGLKKETQKLIWTECVNYVCDTENIMVKKDSDITAYKRIHGHEAKYAKHLRSFGEMAVIRDIKTIKKKLDNRGKIVMFIGYASRHSGHVYRFLNLITNKVVISGDVKWLGVTYGDYMKNKNRINEQIVKEIKWKDEVEVIDDKVKSNDERVEEAADDQHHYNLRPRAAENEENEAVPREIRNLDTSYNDATKIYQTLNDGDTFVAFGNSEMHEQVMALDSELAFLATNEMKEPTTFDEAWNHKDPMIRKKWREAIHKEFRDMINYKVWSRRKKKDIPSDRRLIGNKWVFKIKRCGRFRARLCGLGYTQIPGIDFKENHAPVVNDVTYRILILLKIINNWTAELMDVETAFLNGILEEQIYMKMPEGSIEVKLYEGISEDDCVELHKCIYGTVQSARQWYKRFADELKKLGFERCSVDPCLMKRKNENGTLIICIYVDDVLQIGDKAAIDQFTAEIKDIFTVKNVGGLEDYLGCEVRFDHDNEGAIMYQPHIIKKLESRFKKYVLDKKPKDLPSAPSSIVLRNFEEELKLSEEKQKLYQSGVGVLLYLSKYTRPDISNGIRELSKNMGRANENDLNSLLRMIKYVLETKNMGLKMRPIKNLRNLFSILGFCDSDYATDKDTRKSVTGYVVYLNGVPISWRSRSQRAVTLSTAESEYYAISEICSELIFVKNMLEFLGVELELPIIVNVDNIGAIYLAKNRVLSNRTKHIGVRYHFVREYIEDGIIKIIFVRSKDNDADMFTKNLQKELFNKHRKNVMDREQQMDIDSTNR